MGKVSGLSVVGIEKPQIKEWLKYKHYAGRVPIISHQFGLYQQGNLVGVCTYGPPARMLNDGYGIFNGQLKIKTLELNRLVTNEGLPRNSLSFFVSKTLKMLPSPLCVVSYADMSSGHHGYIYQATNWIYCGMTAIEKIYKNKNTGEAIHPRSINSMMGSRSEDNLPEWVEVTKEKNGKHRYLKFLGSKKEIKTMTKLLAYPIFSYPKGDNKNYNASYRPSFQLAMF